MDQRRYFGYRQRLLGRRAEYKFGIFGLALILMMLFRPEGLIPSARRKAEFEEAVPSQASYDASA